MKRIIILFLSLFLISCTVKKETLIKAIKDNDVKKVQKLISKGVDLYGFEDQEDPTYLICKLRNIELLRTLLDGGYIEYVNDEELTYITNVEWVEALELLVDYGLKIDAMVKYGYSLLDWSINNNKYSLTKKLLEHGANINSDYDRDGNTSFIKALRKSDANFLDYLVKEFDADLGAYYDEDYSVKDYVIFLGDFDKFKLLADWNVDISEVSAHGMNVWELLGYHWEEDESLKMANFLLNHGIGFDYENNLALHIAAEYHEYEYAKWLLENGFDPNIMDEYGITADLYTGELVKKYNTSEPDKNNTYEDVKNKANTLYDLIRSYQK